MLKSIGRWLYNCFTTIFKLNQKTAPQNVPDAHLHTPTQTTFASHATSSVMPTKARRTKRLASVHVIARRPQARLLGGLAKVA